MEHQQQALNHSTFTMDAKTDKDTMPVSCSSLTPNRCVGLSNPRMRAGSSSGCGRERLKRHRSEVAGKVVVPDKWSQEEMLKDWLDCGSFDALLAPKGFDLARAALVAERTQAKEAMESSNKAYIGCSRRPRSKSQIRAAAITIAFSCPMGQLN